MSCQPGEAGVQQPSEAGEQGREHAINVPTTQQQPSEVRQVPFQCLLVAAFKSLLCNSTKMENTAQYVLPGAAFQRCLPDCSPGVAASAAACGAALSLLSVPQ